MRSPQPFAKPEQMSFTIAGNSPTGDTIRERVDRAVQTSDFFLVFLSKASVASQWIQQEIGDVLSREMNDRAITIIPVLIEDCDVPPLLAGRKNFDLTKDVAAGARRLAEQLASAATIDLSRLDPKTFEQLIAELLAALGFEISLSHTDHGIDVIATRAKDPLAAERSENWLVEVKKYGQGRVGIATIQQLIAYLSSASSDTKGLLVTNGNITSVAREFLSDASQRAGREVRVIDGTELTSLLARHPHPFRSPRKGARARCSILNTAFVSSGVNHVGLTTSHGPVSHLRKYWPSRIVGNLRAAFTLSIEHKLFNEGVAR